MPHSAILQKVRALGIKVFMPLLPRESIEDRQQKAGRLNERPAPEPALCRVNAANWIFSTGLELLHVDTNNGGESSSRQAS